MTDNHLVADVQVTDVQVTAEQVKVSAMDQQYHQLPLLMT